MISATAAVSIATVLYVTITFAGRRFRARSIRKSLCLEELTLLGKYRTGERKIQGTAVVCGGRYECSEVDLPSR